MIQPAFDIGNDQVNLENASLLMEVGEKFFNYIIYQHDPKQLLRVRQYNLESTLDKNIQELLEEIIAGDPLLNEPVKEKVILYNFPESSLVPESHFDIGMNKSVTQVVYGDAHKGLVLSEKIYGWDMYNIYRIPKAIHTLFQSRFQAGKYWHFYSLLLSSLNNAGILTGTVIRLVFYNDKFVAAFFSGGQLKMLQTFTYETPEDAAYYLLLMCRHFEVDQHNAALQISGLIDGQSALYAEILKYFPVVEYEGVPDTFNTEDILTEYPAHYFSPLLKMSLCV
ncbi:MAG: DUF3822 family protein [Flavitalea sp.]